MFWMSMGRIVQDYPSYGNWKNAVVVVGGYNIWLNFALHLSRLHKHPIKLLQVMLFWNSMGRLVLQLQ